MTLGVKLSIRGNGCLGLPPACHMASTICHFLLGSYSLFSFTAGASTGPIPMAYSLQSSLGPLGPSRVPHLLT